MSPTGSAASRPARSQTSWPGRGEPLAKDTKAKHGVRGRTSSTSPRTADAAKSADGKAPDKADDAQGVQGSTPRTEDAVAWTSALVPPPRRADRHRHHRRRRSSPCGPPGHDRERHHPDPRRQDRRRRQGRRRARRARRSSTPPASFVTPGHHRLPLAHRHRGRGQRVHRHRHRRGAGRGRHRPPRRQHLPRSSPAASPPLNVLHGSANAIGGQNAVIKLRWGKPPEELLFKEAPPGHQVRAGREPQALELRCARRRPRYPGTRMGVEAVLRDAFDEARAYQQEWQEYERRLAAAGRRARTARPRRDATCGSRPLRDILDGKIFVHAHCYRADEILMLMRVAEEFGFKIAHLPARAGGLQGGQRDRPPRRGRLDLLRLVGLQDGGARRHPLQRRDHGRARA